MEDPKRLVERGYDAIAEAHDAWSTEVRQAERAYYLNALKNGLAPGARILDVGCGSGETARRLEGFQVTGIDISARQIEMAKVKAPAARFVHGDVTTAKFPDASFDGIACFYSLFHLPRVEQGPVIARLARWLAPNGTLVASLLAHDVESLVLKNWLGAPMYWSGFDAKQGEALFTRAGLTVQSAREETALEDGQPITFLWVIAKAASSRR